MQLYQDVGKLEYGCEYRMQFDKWSTLPRDVEYRIQITGNYQAYSMKHISINEKQSLLCFTMDQTMIYFRVSPLIWGISKFTKRGTGGKS